MLSPRLQLKVAQKQILTPGLVQMVTVLQLNRLELKEMINQEIVNNPVLEESLDAGEEITPEELQPLLEAERVPDPADQSLLDAADIKLESRIARTDRQRRSRLPNGEDGAGRWRPRAAEAAEATETAPPTRSTRSISARFSTIISIRLQEPGLRIGRKAFL